MNRKFYVSLLAFALTLLATVAFVVGHNTGTRAASTNAALAALPASDFVIGIDAQRALNETLPSFLVNNPAQLAKLNARLEEFQRKTGINPRSFESIAIGGRFTAARRHDPRMVVIARGNFNADEMVDAAFAAAKAKGEKIEKEEQRYEGKRIILISSTRSLKTEDEMSKDSTAATPGAASRRDKMAIAVLDNNTLAVGELESVSAAVDAGLGRNRVDDELVKLATQTPNAVVGFSGKVPQSFTDKASPNSTIEKYFASIRQFYGAFSANGTEAETSLTLRTETAEQANDIGQALNTIKSLSAFGFSRSSGGDSSKADSLADIIKSLSITIQGNEIQINLSIPQGSIAPFMRTF
ncbi:MAG: hypothetical protein QOH25_2742 [Acidobacteriota bacterium]|jgi:hypothetical protein|nr:hypothetical protein [Acidobacteriota bacterium]